MDWQSQLRTLCASIEGRHSDLRGSGFGFVANVGTLHSSFEFAPGLEIRGAQPNEIDTLRELLLATCSSGLFSPGRNPYETRVEGKKISPAQTQFLTHALPAEAWRYYVLASNKVETASAQFHDLLRASTLTKSRLVLGPTVLGLPPETGFGGVSFSGGAIAFREAWEELRYSDDRFLTLGPIELKDLRAVYEKLDALTEDPVNLRSAIDSFEQLDAVPKHSPLRFLGYVSILESLISHQPDPKDPTDSLTRQVRQKMLLLGNRCRISLPYQLFDHPKVPATTIWTKLYEYRSTVAHGSKRDFTRKLSCLKDSETALKFISDATVAVMRQALEEPALMADLREC